MEVIYQIDYLKINHIKMDIIFIKYAIYIYYTIIFTILFYIKKIYIR